MTLISALIGWLLLVAASIRAWIAWGGGVATFVLVVLLVFRLLVPYGAWFADPVALMIALRAEPQRKP